MVDLSTALRMGKNQRTYSGNSAQVTQAYETKLLEADKGKERYFFSISRKKKQFYQYLSCNPYKIHLRLPA